MLARLCRWLRAAGYDCALLPGGSPDRNIMALAREEGRIILTRDRQFMHFRDADKFVFMIDDQVLDDQARCLAERLHIDWLYRPFTRCMMCNVELVQGTEDQRAGLSIRLRDDEPLRCCPECQRLYWNGGHVHRMEKKLTEWKRKWGKSEIN